MSYVLMLAGFLITGLSGFYTLLYASKFSPVIEKWLINKKILIAANEKGLGFLDIAMFILVLSLTLFGLAVITANLIEILS